MISLSGGTARDQHEYQVFRDTVMDGTYQECWGSFCEQWFMQTDPGYPRRYGDN